MMIDNLVSKFTELLAFSLKPANFYRRNAQWSVPHLGALLACSLEGLAGP